MKNSELETVTTHGNFQSIKLKPFFHACRPCMCVCVCEVQLSEENSDSQ